MIVADTCLIVHLFNETFLTQIAQQVYNKDPMWMLPKLWKEEYANVLSKRARKENQSLTSVLRHYNDTLDALQDSELLLDDVEALKVSIKMKISVYDAHFVSLAMGYHTKLVTEDKEVLKRCPTIAVSMHEFIK